MGFDVLVKQGAGNHQPSTPRTPFVENSQIERNQNEHWPIYFGVNSPLGR